MSLCKESGCSAEESVVDSIVNTEALALVSIHNTQPEQLSLTCNNKMHGSTALSDIEGSGLRFPDVHKGSTMSCIRQNLL